MQLPADVLLQKFDVFPDDLPERIAITSGDKVFPQLPGKMPEAAPWITSQPRPFEQFSIHVCRDNAQRDVLPSRWDNASPPDNLEGIRLLSGCAAGAPAEDRFSSCQQDVGSAEESSRTLNASKTPRSR